MGRPAHPPFWQQAARILNSGQARALLLTGNIHDLFPVERDGTTAYATLVETLLARWSVSNRILVVYELNGPIRFLRESDRDRVRDAWLRWRTGYDADELAIQRMVSEGRVKADLDLIGQAFDENLHASVGSPTRAFEVLRQLCLCSRTVIGGGPVLAEDLVIIVEAADLAIPDAPIPQMSDADRHRISICQDWFSDPGFVNGGDSVLLVSESRSLIHRRIAQLPQLMDVSVPAPGHAERAAFIEWFGQDRPVSAWGSADDLAAASAGLSLQALRQMLVAAAHRRGPLRRSDVVDRVERYIQGQVGEDVIEFKKPEHRLDDVIGFSALKRFLREELIPRFRSSGDDALPGAAVCGPIGGGKTFIFEAVAAELDTVVLVLKNIRSQWFGQTDVIFERLRRVLESLDRVVIFVDEADTQFGGIGEGAHATERRLTGKVQAMMSDPRLRGRVYWLLMTARIHRLSPDIRRPGRVGDLIIPILDPRGEDRDAFLRWMVKPVLGSEIDDQTRAVLAAATEGYYAAAFASVRSDLKAKAGRGTLAAAEVIAVLSDRLAPDIGPTRRYQSLQAMINCTRRSLLPNPHVTEEEREKWTREARELESRGIG